MLLKKIMELNLMTKDGDILLRKLIKITLPNLNLILESAVKEFDCF